MKREYLTDEEVELEIERLRNSKYVKLARKERALQYKRRQKLYILRNLEKHGKQLASQGVTMENINDLIMQEDEENDETV